MNLSNRFKINEIKHNNMRIEFLNSGMIRALYNRDILINQLLTNNFDEATSNIYLRVFLDNKISYYPLITKTANMSYSNTQIKYTGTVIDIAYVVTISIKDDFWFYDVSLTGNNHVIDVVYVQDIGLATKGHVQSNEAYNSQYIDHRCLTIEDNILIKSRQNQAQADKACGLEISSLNKVVAYSTDGYQLYGNEYKNNNIIKALTEDCLANCVYQYEFACIALQSEKVKLDGSYHNTFYGYFVEDVKDEIEKIVSLSFVKEAYANIEVTSFTDLAKVDYKFNFNNVINSEDIDQAFIDKTYPVKKHVEEEAGQLLSFFGKHDEHIILKEKEDLVERSHGHIIISGQNNNPDYVLASTNYIYGLFNAQIVYGNTSFNKLITNARNGLNVIKSSGQRIFIKIDNEYRLLGMPAIYELGFNYSKWFYKINNDIITIKAYTLLDESRLNLEVTSLNDQDYDIVIYQQLSVGPDEYATDINIKEDLRKFTISLDDNGFVKDNDPNINFDIFLNNDYELFNENLVYDVVNNEQALFIKTKISSSLTMQINAYHGVSCEEFKVFDFEGEKARYFNWLCEENGNINIELENDIDEEVARMNSLIKWYSHNARVHYCSPHGLEQYGGAAWGARDIVQGPFEYFLSMNNFDAAKNILKRVFEHQYIEDGTWPQWYMFDNYQQIQHHESHGDIIVWPIKAISDYILISGDESILDEVVCYTTKDGYTSTEAKDTLYNHLLKEVQYIKDNFINDTSLSCYGDGDWDDTLQPANAMLRKIMVSGWTVSLTYQSILQFAQCLVNYNKEYSLELEALALAIKNDFNKYLVKDDVLSGFILFEEDKLKYLLHPEDKETGLNYRLIPMTRSIIGELFTKEQAKAHIALINEHLYNPDGVRLMNTTVKYKGGVNTYFRRGETAANFGREIGLQYVHAHIRYVEAMAKIGNTSETWDGLLRIAPIKIDSVVKNAAKRQSNAYFSSSDAAFNTRYDAMQDFAKIKSGDIAVKGGWRIYSSGPGIYLNQLIKNVLGVRLVNGSLQIDPVLPQKLDGLKMTLNIQGKNLTINYNIDSCNEGTNVHINGTEVDHSTMDNKYREAGCLIDFNLINNNDEITIFSKA